MPAWPVAPPKIGGCSPLHARPPKGAAHWRAERCFFRGACPRKKRILVGSAGCGRRKSATLALPGESVGAERPADTCGGALPGESVGAERPADACGACPAGRVCWVGKAGGCLWGVPCRASLLGRKGRWMPAGRALPGESIETERPADVYGGCPSGRVRWGGRAGGCLRASPLGWRGRRKFATLFGSVVGMVFLQRAHIFVLGKIFWEVAAHLAGLIRYTG